MKKIILMFISCLVLASLPLASFAEKHIGGTGNLIHIYIKQGNECQKRS